MQPSKATLAILVVAMLALGCHAVRFFDAPATDVEEDVLYEVKRAYRHLETLSGENGNVTVTVDDISCFGGYKCGCCWGCDHCKNCKSNKLTSDKPCCYRCKEGPSSTDKDCMCVTF
eukprot:TRINITY_DN129_c0_g1_i1.p7 TRINITY_DN129_c0_g1~~TRINITY_DN129_c0_g1_i1.p7  ORF type:complete len:117 (+),score=27.20 TRINITY_DN129_c0_g1_i1:1280-1630(+)